MRGPEGASVQQCTGATRQVLQPLAEVQGEVAGLLNGPLPGRVGGDPGQVHPAGAALDEHEGVQPSQQHSVDMQEIDGEDPGGLRVQELPPGRACSARRGIDASSTQNLVDGRRRDCHA